MSSLEDDVYIQQLLFEEEEDDAEDQIYDLSLILGATMVYGAEESKRIRSERRRERRLYLVREDLHPNPRTFSAWQRLFRGKSDRAFITTMSVDVSTFFAILEDGFEAMWNSSPIPRHDVSSNAAPALHRRSLDAAGALGLNNLFSIILHQP